MKIYLVVKELLRELGRPALTLLALAALTALAVNSLRPDGGLPWGYRPGAPDASARVTEITEADELERLMELPGAILLDARDPVLFQLGHIPKAQSLPADELASRLGPFLERAKARPGQSQGDLAPVITYCSESLCPLAGRLASALAEAGLKNVFVYVPGFDDWLDLGRPVEK
ncbi:MAG: hypothetical protein LBF58_04800 [Deltaproteobacteria bacterium]|nr:hypothetical protein [Deltaproteobacteria bacterium]